MLIDWDKCQKELTGEIIEKLIKALPYLLIAGGYLSVLFVSFFILGGGVGVAVHGLASMILGVFLYLIREGKSHPGLPK